MSNLYDRREFLKLAGAAAGYVPLIGTALASGPSQPTHAASIKGSAKSVVIPTHEWAGDLSERLDFPGDWQLEVMEMKGSQTPGLTPPQIAQALDKPFGTSPLREVVAGKKRIVITFDDLTRPTPTYTVMPWIMNDLQAAGVKDEQVLLLTAFGSHRAMTQMEVQAKLGKEPAYRYAWQNHNVFENTKEIGTTSRGNRVKLNQTFLAADCKICISGVKGHEQAGLSGGAKAVMPGVAALDTIEYNHWTIFPHAKHASTFKVFHNEMRQDMIEAARMANANFSVQIVMNQHRQPVGVYSGDIVWAHEEAARLAAQNYITPTVKNADIVVANAFPVSAQSFRAQWWMDRSLRDGGTGVLIIQQPLGIDPVHWLNARVLGRGGSSYFDLTHRRQMQRVPRNTQLVIYSQYLTRSMINSFPAPTKFATKWDEVIQILRQRHPGQPLVAVYPYAAMQEQELKLDG